MKPKTDSVKAQLIIYYTKNGKMIPRNDKTVVRPWKYCPYLPFTAPHYVARSRVPLPPVMSLSSFTF